MTHYHRRPRTLHELMCEAVGFPRDKGAIAMLKARVQTNPRLVTLRKALLENKDRALTVEEHREVRRRVLAHAQEQIQGRNREPTYVRVIGTVDGVTRTGQRPWARDDEDGELEWTWESYPDSPPTVGYLMRSVKRFERWAGRAERLGLDKSKPPRHIRSMAYAVTGAAGGLQGGLVG